MNFVNVLWQLPSGAVQGRGTSFRDDLSSGQIKLMIGDTSLRDTSLRHAIVKIRFKIVQTPRPPPPQKIKNTRQNFRFDFSDNRYFWLKIHWCHYERTQYLRELSVADGIRARVVLHKVSRLRHSPAKAQRLSHTLNMDRLATVGVIKIAPFANIFA